MLYYLTKSDSYTESFNFRVSEHGDHKTSFGGFLTILYWIGSLVWAVYFGKDIILRQNPQIIRDIVILEESPYFDLKDSITKNFTVYFSLVDSSIDGKYNILIALYNFRGI